MTHLRDRPDLHWMAAPAALLIAIAVAGVAVPAARERARDELVSALTQDVTRLRTAVEAYARDTGGFPAPVFDLSGPVDGGLRQRSFAPLGHQERWRGPYLPGPFPRPVAVAFWSLPAPTLRLDGDSDGELDEQWARLHRGYGELGDDVVLALDRALDDGRPQTGRVQATPAWLLVLLVEE